MATVTDNNSPSFSIFPINNDRTGWRSFGLPVILVVPHRRDPLDGSIANSQVFNIRIFIEDVPRAARIAGHDHVGQRFPDRELFVETVDSLELADRLIDVSQQPITRDGESIAFEDAKLGDQIAYVTSTNIKDTIDFIPGAFYYDLSDFTIDFEHLPSDVYKLVYETEYFTRVISTDGRNELICIDATSTSVAVLRFTVKHPGEVLEEWERHTPPPYLTNATRAQDTTLALYRPFTDALQDISDESDLLESVNWVFDTPAEVIPYLSQLLGWDLPYFPESLDQLRRAVLRRTVEFQNLAGSRRAIINIFRLFGFEILISNLWWSNDGKRFIRPDEDLPFPYEDQKIVTIERCQIDAGLDAWNDGGFGQFEIPLLYRPQEQAGIDEFTSLHDGGNVSIDCYFVEDDSPAYNELVKIIAEIQDDPSGFGEKFGCTEDSNGFLIPLDITARLSGLEIVGYSQILVSGKLGKASDEILVGPEIPLRKQGVILDREQNVIDITLNGTLDITGRIAGIPRSVFLFITYKRQEIVVPDIIAQLQSNHFDIQVVTEDLIEFANPVFLDFALEFLFRLKAFHSLLNKILLRIELTETYEVTDFCIGGDVAQRFDTDAGMLQVPPAIIPLIPGDINDCSLLDPRSLGFKDADITLRLRKLANLPEEHAAWKVLDDRDDPFIGSTRLAPNQPAPGRDECKFTHFGQDRIVGTRVESRDVERGPSPNANTGIAGFASNPDELSPVEFINNGEFNETGSETSSNNDSGLYGSFTREFTEIRQPHCELDGITDYCYKGRVDDDLLYRPTLTDKEIFRCKPCSIDLGVGVYYTYPTHSQISIPGTAKPCLGSMSQRIEFTGRAAQGNIKHHLTDNQAEFLTIPYDKPLPKKNNSHLGRLYRDYDDPPEATLHFTNRIGDPNPDQLFQLALQRPCLNVQKAILHLPGCRFPRINALEEDFDHPLWDARPWDDDFSTHCGPIGVCGDNEPSFLNNKKIIGSDGNEFLSFDSQPFQIIGNGLVPDIPSLGDHALGTNALFSEDDVIHSVFMKDADANPAVILDQVCDYDTNVDSDDTLEITTPLFNSHNKCETGVLLDFADGYACVSGPQLYTGDDLGRSGLYDNILICLGVPTLSGTGAPSTLLVLLGSGIQDGSEESLRLDCGCLLVDCDPSVEGDTICSADTFLDDDGDYDWNCDHLQMDLNLLEIEPIGVCSIQVDGTIPTLLETV